MSVNNNNPLQSITFVYRFYFQNNFKCNFLKGMFLIYVKRVLNFKFSKNAMCLGNFKCQHAILVTFLLASPQILIEKSMQHSVLIIFFWTLFIALLHHLSGKSLLSISYGQSTQTGVDDHIKKVL